MLVAITAILHVLINHPLAVGAYPLLTLFEWLGMRRGDAAWDALTRRIVFVVFLITTTVGALTGIGIWLSTSVVAPFAIGSLLRVFFFQWLTEWVVFVCEVVLIMAYYLSWDSLSVGWKKKAHVLIGATLSAFSWLTMALIVAILGFMMTSGVWTKTSGFVDAVLNPLYAPQLAFRTTFAMTTAGLFVWFVVTLLKPEPGLRDSAIRLAAGWSLAWLPFCAAASVWYWRTVPETMKSNTGVGLLTQAFSEWHTLLVRIMLASVALVFVFTLAGWLRPRLMPRYALLVPFVLSAWLLGHFERVREFIRKPFVIAGYMYSNGVRVSELPVLQRDGMLTHATYTTTRRATKDYQWHAGRDVFLLACSRCHTTFGMNGVVRNLEGLYGKGEWEQERLVNFIKGMHLTRTFMPPFPGNADEAEALAVYLRSLHPVATRPQRVNLSQTR